MREYLYVIFVVTHLFSLQHPKCFVKSQIKINLQREMFDAQKLLSGKNFIEFLRSRATRIFEAHGCLNKNAVWEASEDPSKSSKEKICHGNFD